MMYDFTYRSPSAPTFGAFVPLKIEGAPDHGTIADAQVWADHYEVRIDLLDGTGRVRRVVGPDGQVRDLKTVWFDAISPSGVEMATARALRESVERMGRVAARMRAVGITRESAIRFRAKWLERYPQVRDYFVVRGADRAMSGKTAFAAEHPTSRPAMLTQSHPAMQTYAEHKMRAEEVDTRAQWVNDVKHPIALAARVRGAMSDKTAFPDDHIGLQADTRVLRVDRPDEFERLRDVALRRIDFWQEPPVSLSYDMVAAFRGQTRSDQFEVKRTAPVRVRHLSGVSVDLLIAVGQIGGA